MAEWSIAAVLKTVELRGSGGSNPSFSAESSKSCFLRFMEAGCFRIYMVFNRKGEMLEWLKRHAWKACKPLKGFAGSNPAFSAEGHWLSVAFFCVRFASTPCFLGCRGVFCFIRMKLFIFLRRSYKNEMRNGTRS